jgi:hypothetical protein
MDVPYAKRANLRSDAAPRGGLAVHLLMRVDEDAIGAADTTVRAPGRSDSGWHDRSGCAIVNFIVREQATCAALADVALGVDIGSPAWLRARRDRAPWPGVRAPSRARR